MRFPQVSDRVKEAPAQALRGVFAGIGQLLLFTDKLRNKTPASQQVPRARVPQPSETAPDAPPPFPGAAPPLPDAAPPLPDTAPPLRGCRSTAPGCRSCRRVCGPAGAGAGARTGADRGHAPAGREAHGGQGLRQDRQRTAADQRRSRSSRAGASHGCGRDDQRSGRRRPGRRDGQRCGHRCRTPRALHCRTMTSYPSRRCGRGCAASTLRSSGSWSNTRRPTPPGATS